MPFSWATFTCICPVIYISRTIPLSHWVDIMEEAERCKTERWCLGQDKDRRYFHRQIDFHEKDRSKTLTCPTTSCLAISVTERGNCSVSHNVTQKPTFEFQPASAITQWLHTPQNYTQYTQYVWLWALGNVTIKVNHTDQYSKWYCFHIFL